MARGLQFWVKGWSGSITVTDGVDSVVVAPSNSSSPFEVLKTLAEECQAEFGGSWSATITGDFFLKLQSARAGTWDATLTGTCASIMGFASSYTSVNSITGTAIPSGGFFPYEDGDGLVYVMDARIAGNQGVQVYDGAYWYNTPGTNHRRPVVRFSCLRSKVLNFVESVQAMGTPAKVQIIDDGDDASFYVGNIRTNETNAIDGWSNINMELIR